MVDSALGTVTVLLVDDSATDRTAVVKLLETLGCTPGNIRQTETGQAALEAVRDRRPDLVLLELGLPDMEGPEVADQLIQTGADRIVLVTEHDEAHPDVQALMVKAQVSYLGKPVATKDLEAALHAVA